MTDRVERFAEEFESAIDAHRSLASELSLIGTARREAAQLAATLDRLAQSHWLPRTLTSADLRALDNELSSIDAPPPLEPLVSNARALLQVVDDGIIDGDATRLRNLLTEADSLSVRRKLVRSSGQTHLDIPARAICLECDDLLVGRRRAALNWNAITKVVRDHERDRHGGYTDAVRDELSEGLRGLRAGQTVVTAGRYQIGQL